MKSKIEDAAEDSAKNKEDSSKIEDVTENTMENRTSDTPKSTNRSVGSFGPLENRVNTSKGMNQSTRPAESRIGRTPKSTNQPVEPEKSNELAKTVFFNREIREKIGDTVYIVNSFFNESGEDLKAKITKLLKTQVSKNVEFFKT